MTKKSESPNEDQTKEPNRKIASLVKSQKEQQKVSSAKEEEDLLLDSGTDSDYDGDVFFFPYSFIPSTSFLCISLTSFSVCLWCDVQSLSGSLNSDDFDSDIFDSEDDGSNRETEDGDEGELVDSENGEEDGSDDEQREVAEESDSSEDEVEYASLYL